MVAGRDSDRGKVLCKRIGSCFYDVFSFELGLQGITTYSNFYTYKSGFWYFVRLDNNLTLARIKVGRLSKLTLLRTQLSIIQTFIASDISPSESLAQSAQLIPRCLPLQHQVEEGEE